MNTMKLNISGLEKLTRKVDEIGGNSRKICEDALLETHAIVTRKAEEAMSKSNLPAGGKFSTGRTLETLRRDANISWQGNMASVSVGFDIDKGGLASIFLMYGTPRMKKDQALYNAFYGKKTLDEIRQAQENVFFDEIRRLGG